MKKQLLALFLSLSLIVTGCTKAQEDPVEIPRNPEPAPEETVDVIFEEQEESHIIGDYVLLDGNIKSTIYPMLELQNRLLHYDDFSRQLECYSTNTGECLWRKKIPETVLAVDYCDYWVGYNYRLLCEDCVIYQSISDSSMEQRIELPMSDHFAESYSILASYDVYGSQLVYCDKNGDVYLGWTNGASRLLLSAKDLDPCEYENVSPTWQGHEYSGKHSYFEPEFVNDGQNIVVKFRTGDDVLYGFVLCDLEGQIIKGLSCPIQYGIYVVNDSKVAIDTGGFGYCLTDVASGETADCFYWDDGHMIATWDYDTVLEINSDPVVPFGPRSNVDLTLDGVSLLKIEGSTRANIIQMTEHFAIVGLYSAEGEEQIAVLRYREETEKERTLISWQESDIPAKNAEYKTVQKTFAPYNGRTLTLTMEIPQDWQLTEGRTAMDDAQGKKSCVSLGIIRELQDGEGITNLENPEDMPFALNSDIVSFENKLCLQTTGVAEDSAQHNREIRSYNFVCEGCLVNVHFYVTKNDPKSDEIVYRVMNSVQADITPKMPKTEPAWKNINFSVSFQDDKEGLITGKAVEISMAVPSNWILDTGNGVIADGDFFYADGTKAAEGFVINLLDDGQSLKDVYEKSLLSTFYIPVKEAPNTLNINGQEVFVVVSRLPGSKNNPQPEQGKEWYSYSYDFPYGENSYLQMTIYAQGPNHNESMQLHQRVLESIRFGDEQMISYENMN